MTVCVRVRECVSTWISEESLRNRYRFIQGDIWWESSPVTCLEGIIVRKRYVGLQLNASVAIFELLNEAITPNGLVSPIFPSKYVHFLHELSKMHDQYPISS